MPRYVKLLLHFADAACTQPVDGLAYSTHCHIEGIQATVAEISKDMQTKTSDMETKMSNMVTKALEKVSDMVTEALEKERDARQELEERLKTKEMAALDLPLGLGKDITQSWLDQAYELEERMVKVETLLLNERNFRSTYETDLDNHIAELEEVKKLLHEHGGWREMHDSLNQVCALYAVCRMSYVLRSDRVYISPSSPHGD